ncbi:MAG: ATP synthase F1 subunit delta [Acidobacteriaceae bacterium]|nr:ATP synthase F1 subunit delta [Acidobacteriaceae bacterium]
MTDALSKHYARALANAVFAPNSGLSPEQALKQLSEAEALIVGSKELGIALLSPAVNRGRKIAIVSKLADDLGLNRIIRNFLLLVVTHRRVHALKAIRQDFETAIDEKLGWIGADITSATELSPAQREEIERALGTKLGKFIRARYKVDPQLLAGVRANVASKQYDATLKGKLEGLRRQLQAGL